jgi:hypothetical protein
MLNSCLHGKNVTVSYFCTQYWSISTGLWSYGLQFKQFSHNFCSLQTHQASICMLFTNVRVNVSLSMLASPFVNYLLCPQMGKQENSRLDVHGSVHHSTIHTEKFNKMQQCIKIYYFIFIWSSTCFTQHTAHHQEPKTALAASGFAHMEDCWMCGCWMHVCKTRGC